MRLVCCHRHLPQLQFIKWCIWMPAQKYMHAHWICLHTYIAMVRMRIYLETQRKIGILLYSFEFGTNAHMSVRVCAYVCRLWCSIEIYFSLNLFNSDIVYAIWLPDWLYTNAQAIVLNWYNYRGAVGNSNTHIFSVETVSVLISLPLSLALSFEHVMFYHSFGDNLTPLNEAQWARPSSVDMMQMILAGKKATTENGWRLRDWAQLAKQVTLRFYLIFSRCFLFQFGFYAFIAVCHFSQDYLST